MPTLDYQNPRQDPRLLRPRDRAGLIVARAAACLSLVPWALLLALKVEVAGRDMGPGAGIGNVFLSFVAAAAAILLLPVWLAMAAPVGWPGRKSAALAFASLVIYWYVTLGRFSG